MTNGWLIGGIFAALAAVFSGGCGVIYFGLSMSNKMAGLTTYGIELIAVVAGIVPGIAFGLIARSAFKRHRQQRDAGHD